MTVDQILEILDSRYAFWMKQKHEVGLREDKVLDATIRADEILKIKEAIARLSQ